MEGVVSEMTSGLLPLASDEPRGIRLDGDMMVDLPAAEVVQEVKDSGRLLILLAKTREAAEVFRRDADLSPRRVVYATKDSVRGYSNYEIIVLPGWHERRDAEQIWESMQIGLLATYGPSGS